ncbi:astacin, partial [Ancylostoma duodenale]
LVLSKTFSCSGHALGFYHEQARYDRDNYVSIVSQNIQNGYLSQFTKQSRSAMEDYGVGFDYGSVMHYDQFVSSFIIGTLTTKTIFTWKVRVQRSIVVSETGRA